MPRVPEEDRCRIGELSKKGYCQRQIRELVSRPLHTVNRTVQAYRYEGRIRDAPRGHTAVGLALAPAHTTPSVQAHLQQTGNKQLAWVPKTADLSIIENHWDRVKVALNRTPMPSATEDELWAAVLAEWQRLASDTSLVKALYESLLSGMSAVAEVNGDMMH
ncbi:hypothetical protein HPB48_011441 [Haemaphysalis longicornis]|uniref:Uncharacterized protein n=1 Tax=Haemaphysalis longicornis TaxID=44386 RepID=A0A9J6G7N9_HAELO|nr:hypothetical protein HPB48_011441 [Haemaphysalis longicornis]